ncbi:hypothetical protein GPJ56_006308 [Histomonas meleagridis]|uniref:uncharacterized protein n=1 Tax=Histomonas meleagridis TaxID=135588 RepID=UPI00355A6259|nr:hypothetical protein GPJ56_006308 [Histomonas meleagridis]KAH0796875.1 hypothetical protein GO595_010768 [Histomonas meleagridis]
MFLLLLLPYIIASFNQDANPEILESADSSTDTTTGADETTELTAGAAEITGSTGTDEPTTVGTNTTEVETNSTSIETSNYTMTKYPSVEYDTPVDASAATEAPDHYFDTIGTGIFLAFIFGIVALIAAILATIFFVRPLVITHRIDDDFDGDFDEFSD